VPERRQRTYSRREDGYTNNVIALEEWLESLLGFIPDETLLDESWKRMSEIA